MPGARWSRLQVISALVALVAVVFCTTWLVTAPDAPPPRPAPVVQAPKPVKKPALPSPVVAVPIKTPPRSDPKAIDPEIQHLSDMLTEQTEPPPRDLEIVDDFIEMYRKVFQQGNPIGLNEDITSVLTGHNPRKGILFPPGSPMIVRGQLVDRWGTPYWFHPSSSFQMEIRSAGPDKNLFTQDDVVRNPGPDNMGIGLGMTK